MLFDTKLLKADLSEKSRYIRITRMKSGPDFEAVVTLLPTEEGGREGYTVTGYRPQCELADGWRTTGAHQYIGRERLYPGESSLTNISLLSPLERCLCVGSELRIMEASKVVGLAKVTKIFNKILCAESGKQED
jgi:translation elongation factor EF-Tu-like GTPase